MTLFEDLCKKYDDKHKRDIEFMRSAGIGAAQFASSFQQYINAPDTYHAQDDRGSELEYRYIDVVLVDSNWNEISRNYRSIKDMCFNQNCFLLFYLMVTLEMGPDTYPKKIYRFPCGIKPIPDSQYCVFIGRPGDDMYKEFAWSNGKVLASGPEQYIIDLLVDSLDHQPL